MMSRICLIASLALALVLVTTNDPYASQQSDSLTIEVAQPMKYVRLYADSTGASHFADEELTFTLADFAPPAPPISVSNAIQSDGAVVISSPVGWQGDWHPAPQRQYVIWLEGQLQVEVSDGEVRTFGPGAVVLVEDTWGKGHISRVIGKVRGYAIVVPIKDK
jgi:oxalate decarboxylase/phosphoglucose isomerase-like protein (cupin superfamily)